MILLTLLPRGLDVSAPRGTHVPPGEPGGAAVRRAMSGWVGAHSGERGDVR